MSPARQPQGRDMAWINSQLINGGLYAHRGLSNITRDRNHYGRSRFSTCAPDLLENKKAQLTQGLRATAPSFQDRGCSKMAVSRHLGYYRTGNSAIRSADPENPCLEPHMEWIGCTVCENYTVTLKLGFGVTQGHWELHHEISRPSAGLTMVQVVHLNRGLWTRGPHNFTEIIFIHKIKYIKN